MNHPVEWLLLLGTFGYGAALGLTLYKLVRREEPLYNLNRLLILTGWLIQSTGLWFLGLEAGSCPVRNPFEVLQFVSWSIVIIYLFTGQVFRLSLFGTGSASLAAIIGLSAFIIPGGTHIGPYSHLGGDPRIEAHAALALFSYGVFGLLAVLSILYLLQNYSLKKKKWSGIFRYLPSIMDMDSVLLRLLMVGCFIYTTSIVIGALYWFGHLDQVSTFKIIATTALWIAYWVVLALRLSNRLFGTSLAWACLGLMAAAMLALWPVEASRDHGFQPPPPAMISQLR